MSCKLQLLASISFNKRATACLHNLALMSRNHTGRNPSWRRQSYKACGGFEYFSPFLKISCSDIVLGITIALSAYAYNPQLTALNNKLLMYYIWQYKNIRGWTSALRLVLFHIEENYCFGPDPAVVTAADSWTAEWTCEQRKSEIQSVLCQLSLVTQRKLFYIGYSEG